MKVWLMEYIDYDSSGPVGVFDSIEAVFAHYPNTDRQEWRPEKDNSFSQYRRTSVRSKEWRFSGNYVELVDVETVESVERKA